MVRPCFSIVGNSPIQKPSLTCIAVLVTRSVIAASGGGSPGWCARVTFCLCLGLGPFPPQLVVPADELLLMPPASGIFRCPSMTTKSCHLRRASSESCLLHNSLSIRPVPLALPMRAPITNTSTQSITLHHPSIVVVIDYLRPSSERCHHRDFVFHCLIHLPLL
jgi:hypothetical protein